MLRELLNHVYLGALSAYIAVDIWLFHRATEIEEYIARRS